MKKFLAICLCGVMLLSFAACTTDSTKDKKGKDVVRLGEVTHSVFYAPQYAAMSLGFFEEEGIKIELSNLQGADKVMSAVLSNQIDIGFFVVLRLRFMCTTRVEKTTPRYLHK